jgi:hypothetical protein
VGGIVVGGGWKAARDLSFFFGQLGPGAQAALAAARASICVLINHHRINCVVEDEAK